MAPAKKAPTAGTALATNTATELGIPVGMHDVGRSGSDAMDEILAEIAKAGSVEEALAGGTVLGLDDFDGKTLVFEDFHYQPSDFDPDGWPFVVAQVVTGDGERIHVTSGAKRVVALLALARKRDELPFKAGVQVTPFETDDGERRSVTALITA
jgi:hypothetical protein